MTYDIIADWQILANDFDKWLAILISDNIFLSIQIHITSLDYLNKRTSQFIKLLNIGNKESNQQLVGLNIVALNNKNKEKPLKIELSNLELE